MGRGRAKAKQQKVARDLKYNSHFTDLDALQRELGVAHPNGGASAPPDRVNGDAGGDADDEDDLEDDPADDHEDGRPAWGAGR